jgi:hypothetical protein
MAIAGFTLSIVSIFIGWIPFFGAIPLGLALLFSFFGLFGKSFGLALAGLIVSVVAAVIYQAIWFAVLFGPKVDSIGVRGTVL